MRSVILLGFMVVVATAAQGRGQAVAAKGRAGEDPARSAAAEIKHALECERVGDESGRRSHLEKALMIDPQNERAWGLVGGVLDQGKWRTPDAVAARFTADPAQHALLNEYDARRRDSVETPDSQFALASWCDSKGLKAQAVAHYLTVLRLDSAREIVWKRLGYKKVGARWAKPEEIAAARHGQDHQRRADRDWAKKLARIRDGLDGHDPHKSAKAEEALKQVSDPRAVPMMWSIFMRGSERAQLAAIKRLSDIDGPAASHCLASLAVLSPRSAIRAAATDALVDRDPRDFVGKMIGLLRQPIDYELRPMNGPGSAAKIIVKQDKNNVEFDYQPPMVDPSQLPRFFTSQVPFNPFSLNNMLMASAAFDPGSVTFAPSAGGGGMPGMPAGGGGRNPNSNQISNQNSINQLAFQTMGVAAEQDLEIGIAVAQNLAYANRMLQQKLANDVQTLEGANARIKEIDERALMVLRATTGKDFGVAPATWRKWWAVEQGYLKDLDQAAMAAKINTPAGEKPREEPITQTYFASGTIVRTIVGLRLIDSIQLGDLVLTQDVANGRLAFDPVMAISHHNKSKFQRVILDDKQVLLASRLSRIWKVGAGWTKAADLKPGDRLRVIGGSARVQSVDAPNEVPSLNLDIAGQSTFFAGSRGVLVHDNSLVEPALVRFDDPAAGEAGGK